MDKNNQMIVFGIFFEESAKKEYGTLMNIVRHTFQSHFDEYYDPEKWHGMENTTGPEDEGSQAISTDPAIKLYWRNYKPDELDEREPGKVELFLNVAMERFINDNRKLYAANPTQSALSVLGHFKRYIGEMIKKNNV